MDFTAQRQLEILRAISEGRPVTQRVLAKRLGVALGLANLYVKRLVRKGYLKITTIPPNRIKYLVTPRGLAEKTRLTYEYVEYSLRLYRDTRRSLHELLSPLANGGGRVVLCGTGEAAELAFLTLKELGLEPVAVMDGEGGGRFLGYPVLALGQAAAGDYDHIVVASLTPPDRLLAELDRHGIPAQRVILLRRSESPPRGVRHRRQVPGRGAD